MFKRKITELLTATTTDLGIWLKGKLVLYVDIFGKSENRA